MTKIKDLKEKDRLVGRYLIKSCTKGTTSKGAPYLNLVLQDNSGSMDAKFWDVKPEDEWLEKFAEYNVECIYPE